MDEITTTHTNDNIFDTSADTMSKKFELPRAAPLPGQLRLPSDAERTGSQATTVNTTRQLIDKEKPAVDVYTTNSHERPANMPLWTLRIIMMAILVSLGGFIFGYGGIGQIGGFLAMQSYRDSFGNITKADGKRYLSDIRQGTIAGILMIGALISSLLAGSIADKIGRKKSITIWAGVFFIGQIIEISSMTAWYQIVIGRTIEGLGIGGLSILVPMYQGETAPKEARGLIISMYQLFITLGILLASLINLGTEHLTTSASWRITIGCGMIWPLVLGIGIQFLPESPHWDLRRDSVDSAADTIARIYGTTSDNAYVMREVQEMQDSIRAEGASDSGTGWKQFWREPTILRRFVVGMVLQAMQQLTGINYFFYFGTVLFANLHVGDSYVTAVILGTVNFVATFVGLWIAKRFGHRTALTLGGFWIGTSLLFYAFFGHYCIDRTCSIPAHSVGTAMVVFTCTAIIGFATTWGPLAWVVCAEIFPARWRAAGMGAATATNWTFNFLIAFFTTYVTNEIGFSLGWVFAGAIIVGACFVWVFVHETAGKSLEGIDREILEGVKPWDSRKGR